MKKIKYYLFCIKWLWKNRDWQNTRQKFKTMNRECNDYLYSRSKRR